MRGVRGGELTHAPDVDDARPHMPDVVIDLDAEEGEITGPAHQRSVTPPLPLRSVTPPLPQAQEHPPVAESAHAGEPAWRSSRAAASGAPRGTCMVASSLSGTAASQRAPPASTAGSGSIERRRRHKRVRRSNEVTEQVDEVVDEAMDDGDEVEAQFSDDGEPLGDSHAGASGGGSSSSATLLEQMDPGFDFSGTVCADAHQPTCVLCGKPLAVSWDPETKELVNVGAVMLRWKIYHEECVLTRRGGLPQWGAHILSDPAMSGGGGGAVR